MASLYQDALPALCERIFLIIDKTIVLFSVLRAEDPLRKAREFAQEYGRDLSQVERGIAEGSPIPPAIVLRNKNGKLILLGGNTRLMAGAAAGVSMPVKIVNVDSKY
jgi:hypothetical protein